MASEHVLQLKAVLDTSDVKQKLDQLKSQTTTNVANATSGNGSTMNLASSMRSLNMTLQTLQRSIDKLAANSGVHKSTSPSLPVAVTSQSQLASKAASSASSNAFSRANSFSRNLSSVLSDLRAGFSSGIMKNEMKNLRTLQNEYRRFARGSYTGRQFYNKLNDWDDYTVVEQFQDRVKSADNFQKSINIARRNGIKNSSLLNSYSQNQHPMSAHQKRINRQLVALGAGVVLGGIADYAQATGNTGIAKTAKWGSNIAMGAGMGAVMGGPVGAAIGGAAGLLQSAFQELAASAKDAADALEQQRQNFFKGQAVDVKVSDFLQQREDKAALKKGDIGYFQREAENFKKRASDLEKSFAEGEIGFGGKGDERFKLREYQRQTQKMMEKRGANDPEVKRRLDYAKLYTHNIDVWMKHSNRAEQMQEIAEQLKGKQPKVDIKQSILSDHLDTLTERLSGMKAPDLGNVNSLASQGFMISKSDDEARLSQQNDYLRDIANITREIKNIEQQRGEGATYS